jgi:uncharacterized protein YyaL (SSP411 family)
VGHDPDLRRRADWVLETLAEPVTRYGLAFGHLLQAADTSVHGAVEVALVGQPESPDFRALADEVGRHFVPALVVAGGAGRDAAGIALLDGRSALHGQATAYVCRQYACDVPATDARTLGGQLAAAVRTARPADTLP